MPHGRALKLIGALVVTAAAGAGAGNALGPEGGAVTALAILGAVMVFGMLFRLTGKRLPNADMAWTVLTVGTGFMAGAALTPLLSFETKMIVHILLLCALFLCAVGIWTRRNDGNHPETASSENQSR